MALSGSFYNNVNSNWRLVLEWTASQNLAGNYSDVTAKMYWQGLNQYGTTYSSATKDGAIVIAGTTSTFSGGGLAKITGSEKKLIHTYTKRVNHNADGTGSVTLGGYFDVELTLSGTYYGRVNLPTKTFTLNTIPRASTLTGTPWNWTAGNDLALSVARASSSFTHTVQIYVQKAGEWNHIADKTGIGSSATQYFTTAQNKEIFTSINGGSSANTLIKIITYNGSTEIGRTEYRGKVSIPTTSLLTTAFDHYVYVDQTISGEITRYNPSFTHTVAMKLGSFTKTLTNVDTSFTWTPTSSEQQSLYAQTPTSMTKDGSIEITTYYEGVKVGSTRAEMLQFQVRNSNPTFNSSDISYKDSNTTTAGITGNNQIIIQGMSDVTALVNVSAKAVNGASLVSYVVSLAGAEKTLETATGSVVLGKVSQGDNQSLEITAIDSRGLKTKVSKTVTIVPYQVPKITLKLDRENKFETTTRIDVTGTFSPLQIGTANKNLIQGLKYSYKPKGATSWTASDVAINFTTSGSNFTGNKFSLNLDNTKTWEFEFVVNDKFGTTTGLGTVGTGSPILFVDSERQSIGVGKFPQFEKSMEVEGNLATNGSLTSGGGLMVFGTTDLFGDSYVGGKLSTNGGFANTGGVFDNGWWDITNVWEASFNTINVTNNAVLNDVTIQGNITMDNTRITESSGVSYLQSGASGSDTNAELRITRTMTTSLPLKQVGIYTDNLYVSGEIQAEPRYKPSLASGWSNYGGIFEGCYYYKTKEGNVHLGGLLKGGTSGTLIFTLPAGYRPSLTEVFIVATSGSEGKIYLYNDGRVVWNTGGASGFFSLNGISFKAYN